MILEQDKMILGKIFKTHRKQQGLTQFELAEKIGLNEKQISRIEAGQNYPTYQTFAKLIDVLNIDIRLLFGEKQIQCNKTSEEIEGIIKKLSDKELLFLVGILKVMKANFKILYD